MSSLLHPPTHLPPSVALHLSQQAPLLLQKASPSQLFPSIPYLTTQESAETWTNYENLLVSCLRTGDDKSARLCLERLSERFGERNERVMGLKGLYDEAVAEDRAALGHILMGYEEILQQDPVNMPIAKRRVALLRSMSRPADAISALVELAENSPTDAEIWAELSDAYFVEGLYSQAIFAMEETLLIVPNAWNLHAKLGELNYINAITPNKSGETSRRGLVTAMRRFCRSVELCDDYLRGYYGIKLTTTQLLSGTRGPVKTEATEAGEEDEPSRREVEKLNELATEKLTRIVRKGAAKEPGWTGYEQAGIIAARELLDRDAQL